ncbi:hypothetical protein [Paraburkholderia sediminicola]|uniref:hypothetical protein n=1 Tax=Paraburkholderia sediminicola TaxID=458836 RepID=UPI0038BA7522
MSRFMLSCGTIVFLLSTTFGQNSAAEEYSLVRGLYWNKTEGPSLSIDKTGTHASIAFIKSLGVGSVHIWLNDNEGPRTCDEKFDYHEQYWNPTTLRNFTRLLFDSGVRVVYVLTPKIQTHGFINSLMGKDGPVGIAAEFASVDIEFDMEYNWTEKARDKLSKCETMSTETASSLLITALKKTSPTSKVIVSTTGKWMGEHEDIMKLCDIISPQLYEDRYASTPRSASSSLREFLQAYPNKSVIPALSIQCSEADKKNDNCSDNNFSQDEILAASLHACNPEKYPSYTIWAANELRQKCSGNGSASVCSYFGEKYLIDSSATLPTSKCDTTLFGRAQAKQ